MNLPIKIDIPESFYDEEVRCNHTVTIKEKKVWAVELDLLNEFKRVCKKYDLRWYAAYGTLLGTVRHKGFIPWDNDVDVWMPREDFRKLCGIADEFEHPYFLQTPVTEKGRYFSFYGKLCNSLTTGSAKYYNDLGINCGISLDIFILDDIPDDPSEEKELLKKMFEICHYEGFVTKSRHIDFKHPKEAIKTILKLVCWKTIYRGWNGTDMYNKVDEIAGSTLGKGYKKIAVFLSAERERDRTSKECWKDIEWQDFEMIQVPVPCGYDTILTARYGDYMKLPDIKDRVTHDYLEYVADIPYTEYWK